MSEEKQVSEKLQTIIETVKNLSVMELADLVHALEDEFGVSAQAVAVAGPAAAAGEAAVAEEPTSFTVTLTDAGSNKIQAIKVVRAITGLGLADAKAFVEGCPKVVKEDIEKGEAEELKKQFDEIGAKVDIKGV
jgi:large subunit ribosomal protein L7/L12